MPADSLASLRERVASLQVIRCRMVHERVRIEDGAVLRVSRGGREPDLVRMGLCNPEVRGRNLACGHTMARYILLDAVRALQAAGGPHDALLQALESVSNAIHLLDHQKGEAERQLALASERAAEAESAATRFAAEIKRLEERHDAYTGQMRELQHTVLAHLDAAIRDGGVHSGSPAARFAELVEALRHRPDVAAPDEPGARKRFGGDALKVNGKIFAMLVDERLVVKLPKQRVAELAHDGHGAQLDTGQGRLMKEWLSLAPESPLGWLDLSMEALAFVGQRTASEHA